MNQQIRPKVTIGLPVYNGEKFIRKNLDSLLSQSYPYFELIISDNASTDSTSSICKEYEKKDKRIRYIRQKKNMGAVWNFYFVLHQAKHDFFMWAAADDLWDRTFLEKNVNVLLSNEHVVSCVSKVKWYSLTENKLNKIDSFFQNFLRRVRSLKSVEVFSLFGSYDKKVTDFLKKGHPNMCYGVFRTDKLQKSFKNESFVGNDSALILTVLQFGDCQVIDETLMFKYYGGMSRKGMLYNARQFNRGLVGILFPEYAYTCWCVKHLGKKLFFRNITYFVQLNLWGEFSLIIDLIRILLLHIYRKL